MASLILMIISILITFGLLGYGIYRTRSIVKSPTPLATKYDVESKKLGYLSIASSVSTLLIFIFLALFQKYHLTAGDYVQLILGSIIFGGALPAFIYSFFIHYYGKEIPKKIDKLLFINIFVTLGLSAIGLLLLTNGVADALKELDAYPLVNGLSFQNGFTRPGGIKPNLAWYALCILSGAVLVYIICDHRFYVEYGKHGIVESTFFVAFPAGIIGARIGYVIGEWNHSVDGALSFAERVANGEWWAPLAIWEGGLTIISGALIGIVVGVLWFIWRNKKYSIWLAVDIIVPTILVAQAVGRWGNFFNAEVHGTQVLASNYWFLPKIVLNNMVYSESEGFASSGHIFAPLFYIEFLSNLTGYFVIRFAFGKGLRKYLELGDLAFMYLVWYGLTRVILEPFRDKSYNMGQDGYWSWLWSIVFVLVGTALIFINHLVRHLIRKHNHNEMNYKSYSLISSLITSGVLLLSSLAFTILGSIYMSGSVQDTSSLSFNKFNNGLIILIIGLSLLMVFSCSLIYLFEGKKSQNEKI